jgi:hypothetical protein
MVFVVANIGGALTGDGSKFFQAELATFRTVFDEVRIYKVIAERDDSELQNLILVGIKGNRQVELPEKNSMTSRLLEREYRGQLGPLMPALTDDLAPVEYYNSIAQNFESP